MNGQDGRPATINATAERVSMARLALQLHNPRSTVEVVSGPDGSAVALRIVWTPPQAGR